MESTCRGPISARPSRYIGIILTITTQTAIERLRRRPLPISPRRNWNRMSCLAPSRAQRSLVWTLLWRRKSPAPGRGSAAARPMGPRLVRVATDGPHAVRLVPVGAVGRGVGVVVAVGHLRHVGAPRRTGLLV